MTTQQAIRTTDEFSSQTYTASGAGSNTRYFTGVADLGAVIALSQLSFTAKFDTSITVYPFILLAETWQYTVEYSADGSSWTTLDDAYRLNYSGFGDPGDEVNYQASSGWFTQSYAPSAISARYVRLVLFSRLSQDSAGPRTLTCRLSDFRINQTGVCARPDKPLVSAVSLLNGVTPQILLKVN